MSILRLDLSTDGYATIDVKDAEGNVTGSTLMKGIDGQFVRFALDVASNQEYVQVFANIPQDLTEPKAAKRREVINALMETGTLLAVSGHGVWCKITDAVAVFAKF